mgnify:CR=1 FL=1
MQVPARDIKRPYFRLFTKILWRILKASGCEVDRGQVQAKIQNTLPRGWTLYYKTLDRYQRRRDFSKFWNEPVRVTVDLQDGEWPLEARPDEWDSPTLLKLLKERL